jgi:hypothetical protein
MAWHERKWASALLRLAGLALLCLATFVARRLFGIAHPEARLNPLDYLLALIGFASASTGSALTVMGRHLFDQVALSARWTIYRAPPPPRRRR